MHLCTKIIITTTNHLFCKMESRNGEKVLNISSSIPVSDDERERKGKKKEWVLVSLRVVAFLATASATLVMALNKQTKTFLVATVGNTPVTVTLAAKFNQTPAFVFFVLAYGNASLHNLVMVALEVLGPHYDYKGFRLAFIAILDVMALSLASAGGGAATFMSELGRNGNSHAKWDKICDKFETYCNRGGAALITSFVGSILLLIITLFSIIKLVNNPNRVNHHAPR